MAAVPPDDIQQRLDRVGSSTARLGAALTAFDPDEDALRQPSLLPGWTRGQVLTHLARNADAIRRAVDGARRGEPAEMYPGGDETRAADIDAGAARDAPAVLADALTSAQRLEQAWAALPAAAWDVTALTRTGPAPTWRLVPARWREVEIHWVDLAVGYGPADWPAMFVASLLPALVDEDRLGPRLPDGLAVHIVATDSGHEWSVGTGDPVGVRGPSWALTSWLVGRPGVVADVLADPPRLAPWA
jgi:maleylpyruvate isomerase